jgi:hypothetical protein
LLLERAAEIRCQQTWRTIRHTLAQLQAEPGKFKA